VFDIPLFTLHLTQEEIIASEFYQLSWYLKVNSLIVIIMKNSCCHTWAFQLPYYIDGDVKITQSHAILRHVARKYKLDGETENEKAVVDMIIEEAIDLRHGIVKITYTSVENYVSANISLLYQIIRRYQNNGRESLLLNYS
jgi:hypothetical protein